MKKQASKIESDERVKFIIECRGRGVKSTTDLFHFFAEKYPGLCKRTFENYLKKAREEIKKSYQEYSDSLMEELVHDLWILYNKNLKIQDYRECRNIIKSVADLTGCSKVNIPTKDKSKVKPEDHNEEQSLTQMIASR